MVVSGVRNNLPEYGKTIQLSHGIELTQGETATGIFGISSNLTLKIKTKTNTDLVRQIYDFTEKFLTDMMLALDSIPIIKQTPTITHVTPHRLDEKNYRLLDYNYPDDDWQPVNHYQMGDNLITYGNDIKSYMPMNKSKIVQLEDFMKKDHSYDCLTEESIKFYKIGIKLEDIWKNGSYLTFYKIIENYLKNEYKQDIMKHHPDQIWDKIDNKKRLKWLIRRILFFILLVIIGIIVFKTISYKSKQINISSIEAIPIEDDVVKRLSEIVQITTTSYDERIDTAAFLAFQDYLDSNYVLVDSLLEKEIVNDFSIVYKWPGKNPRLDPVLLLGHIDVVPVEKESWDTWTHPPYSGAISDGFVWGRGTLDDKVSILGVLEAIELLLKEDYQPERTVYLACGHDEEISGFNGAQAIARMFKQQGLTFEYVLDE
ncbi:MAG: M20/M25/M40 family metallo-hydrolase, partial [Thaumarchaeota archaeon]|nr:M20/M25/M40 family metallo-hydrolase [Nitrososphaerota archaeon]